MSNNRDDTSEPAPDIDLTLPEQYMGKWAEIHQAIKDYIYHGASYEVTLSIIQECGLSYLNAVKLLSDIDMARLEIDTEHL